MSLLWSKESIEPSESCQFLVNVVKTRLLEFFLDKEVDLLRNNAKSTITYWNYLLY